MLMIHKRWFTLELLFSAVNIKNTVVFINIFQAVQRVRKARIIHMELSGPADCATVSPNRHAYRAAGARGIGVRAAHPPQDRINFSHGAGVRSLCGLPRQFVRHACR